MNMNKLKNRSLVILGLLMAFVGISIAIERGNNKTYDQHAIENESCHRIVLWEEDNMVCELIDGHEYLIARHAKERMSAIEHSASCPCRKNNDTKEQ